MGLLVLFFYSYEAEFIQKLVQEKKKALSVAFYSILDILMIFYPLRTVTFTIMLTQYFPVSLK